MIFKCVVCFFFTLQDLRCETMGFAQNINRSVSFS